MLPKIEQPHYKTTLPISKKEVTYRPYLMKEQKIILLAMNSSEIEDVSQSIIQIIGNCTEGTVDANDLNSIDIGYLLTKIRSSAEGGVVDVNMRCKNIVDGEPCNHLTPEEVDLNTMKIVGEIDEEKSKIDLGGGIGIKLKLPGLEMFKILDDDNDNILDIVPLLIDFIYDGEGQIFKLQDEKQESVDAFIDQLNTQNINEITEFFETMPKIVVEVPFICEKCNHAETVIIEDIQSFLD